MYEIYKYSAADWPACRQIFYDAVHNIPSSLCSDAEKAAWAPAELDSYAWQHALAGNTSFVTRAADGTVVGFCSISGSGYLALLYVAPHAQRRGVANALLAAAEEAARSLGVTCITSEVSRAARPCFEKHGYTLLRPNSKKRRGVTLHNFVMQKTLETPAIDWAKQWELHGANFHDGCAHIPVGEQTCKLYPGPGFGDFSHPTTRLSVAALQEHAAGKRILDIGSGSGVLSICAALLGASACVGIEIERSALPHAERNAALNACSARCSFVHPNDGLPGGTHFDLVLMNMISSQQKEAWPATLAHGITWDHLISSGILLEERESYLSWAASQNAQLVSEQCEAGWLSFHFVPSAPA